MKHKTIILLSIIILACVITACSPNIKNLQNIEDSYFYLSEESVVLNLNEQYVLEILADKEINPNNYIWESENNKIARVLNDGTVTGLSAGSTVITASSQDRKISRECIVIVNELQVNAIAFHIFERLEYGVGEEISLSFFENNLYVQPLGAPLNDLVWETSDNSIAQIKNDVIRFNKKGETKLIAKTPDDLKAEILLFCIGIKPLSIELDVNELVLYVGDTYNFNTKMNPKEANTDLIYEVLSKSIIGDNVNYFETKIAEIDKHGTLVAKHSGEAVVFVKTVGGIEASCGITIWERSPITITNVSYYTDYFDGVEWSLQIENNTDKKIKYVTINFECINAVNDVIRCKVSDSNSVEIKYTGPLEAHELSDEVSNWSRFYNTEWAKIKLLSAQIEFMDGTKKYIRYGSDVPNKYFTRG